MLKRILPGWCSVLLLANASYAQLDQVFTKVFDKILNEDLRRSPIEHLDHYNPAALEANMTLTPALNALLAGNIASFPFTSTVAGVAWDFSTGAPVSIKESLGPIFAETAETLGKGKLNVGFNYSYLNLTEFRGVATEELRFTFTHRDVNDPGLGDQPTEGDIIDLTLGMDVDANLFAFFATLGVTPSLDFGVSVPFVDIRLRGATQATLYGPRAGIDHFFAGGEEDNPRLTDTVPYDERAAGLGDVALRMKYNFFRSEKNYLAVLGDLRVPTGKENDFLGARKPTVRLSAIWSKKSGDLTPHLNLSYDHRPTELDSDELEFAAGFDQKIGEMVTFAVDILGEYDLNDKETIRFFAEPTKQIVERVGPIQRARAIALTNIPRRDQDNVLNAALGFRIAPSDRFLLLGNVLIPMNDGGLRSSVVPTFGFTLTF